MKTFRILLIVTTVLAAIASANAASLASSIVAPLYNSTTVINNAGLNPVVKSAASPENKTPDATLKTGTWSTNFIVPKSFAMPQFRFLFIDMKIQGFDLGKFVGVNVKIDDESALSKETIDRDHLVKESKKSEVYASPEGAYKGSTKFCKGSLTAGALTLRADGVLVIDTNKLDLDQYCLEFSLVHEGKIVKDDWLIWIHVTNREKTKDTNSFYFTLVNPSVYLDDYCQAQAGKSYEDADGRIKSLAFSSYYDENLKSYWTLIDTPISANLRANTLWREAVKEQKPLEKLNVQGDCTHWVKLQKDGKDFSGWVNIKVSEQQGEPFLIQGPMIPFDGAKVGPQQLWIREDGKDAWTVKSIDVRPNGVTTVTL
jgi:hypothetical protein